MFNIKKLSDNLTLTWIKLTTVNRFITNISLNLIYSVCTLITSMLSTV